MIIDMFCVVLEQRDGCFGISSIKASAATATMNMSANGVEIAIIPCCG